MLRHSAVAPLCLASLSPFTWVPLSVRLALLVAIAYLSLAAQGAARGLACSEVRWVPRS